MNPWGLQQGLCRNVVGLREVEGVDVSGRFPRTLGLVMSLLVSRTLP